MVRSGKIRQFLLALVLTVFMWLIHNLSLEYSSTMQYSVVLSSNLEGYGTESVSNEVLMLRGTTSGYQLMRIRGLGRGPAVLNLKVDASQLEAVEDELNTFRLKLSDIAVRDQISKALGENVSLESIDSQYLTFEFEKRSFKRVPVKPMTTLTYKKQYMPVGGTVVTPDSVTVYGSPSELDGVTEIPTETVRYHSLDRSVQGYVRLVPPSSLHIYPEKVNFSVKVLRYVEASQTVEVFVRDVPEGRTVRLFPSKVKVTYRTRFEHGIRTRLGVRAYVDYSEYELSSGSRVIPRIELSDTTLCAYSIEPKTVECIFTDERQ